MNEVFMRRALDLAKKGIGFTSPNPCVGAVIVKGDYIIAEGWHKKAGTDHAEIVAMKEVMRKSGIVIVDFDPTLFHNATLYTTLEPCVHNGKTPPCVKAIVAAGFKKVCIGMKDPNKIVNGRGIRFLKENGIDVEVCKLDSKLGQEVRRINQPFIKWATYGIPYVVMKAGISLDGKIAPIDGKSKWITSEKARKDARIERSKYDVVLVGAGTVVNDDCELAAHSKYRGKKLLRVIIDRKLALSPRYNVFRDENVFVATTDLASERNKKKMKDAGIKFKSFGKDAVLIPRLLKYLGGRGIQSVFVEGGSSVHGMFFDTALKNKKILDNVLFYIAPTLIGGGQKSLSVIGGEGAENLAKAMDLEKYSVKIIGEDVKIEGEVIVY